MPRDIRNVERGACIEGCRSCPNFLSVEPGRVLCDYCGCPPTKHELIQSHSLLAIHGPAEYNPEQNCFKEMSNVKNEGLCFTASRTSSDDSGCYMSSFSIGSSSTNSASISSSSPYVSEEEGLDDCFLPQKQLLNESQNIPSTHKLDASREQINQESFSGVYSCPNHEMLVTIRSRKDCSSPLLKEPIVLNTSSRYEKDVKYVKNNCPTTEIKTCKRRPSKSILDVEECTWEARNKSHAQFHEAREETANDENCTLQEMRQLEIDEKIHDSHIRRKETSEENKIIRTEGDYDVSGHQHELVDGKIVCHRRLAFILSKRNRLS